MSIREHACVCKLHSMDVLVRKDVVSSTSVPKMAAGVFAVQMQPLQLLPAEMQQEILLLVCRHRVSPSEIIGEKTSEEKKKKPSQAAGASRLHRLSMRGSF